MPKGGKAAAEKARLETALKAASDDARRMYTTHEKERRTMETSDKAALDAEQFERLRERERLRGERDAYVEVEDDLKYLASLALGEAKKHAAWGAIDRNSWLPDVSDAGQIAAFLARWAEDQDYSLGMMDSETVVHLKVSASQQGDRNVHIDNVVLQRLDTPPAAAYRKRRVEEDLAMSVKAVKLAEDIWRASDDAAMVGDAKTVAVHREHLRAVYKAVQEALDRLTCLIVHNVEVFADPEDDFLLRTAPPAAESSNPLIKYGICLRTTDKRGGMGVGSQLMYQTIAIFIEPKDSSSVRLPRALGLTNSNATVRAMQLSFDPCSVNCKPGEGQRFIALDCVLVLESLTLPERIKKTGDWGLRTELTTAPTLQRNDYPPISKKGSEKPDLQPDELMMKVTFELPKTVAIRQNNLKIGKWNRTTKQWEHTAVATLTQESLRRFTFLTTDLTTLAVIQDKGHEVPYESWRLNPISDDEVLVHLLGRLHDDQHHTDTSAREVQIVIRDDQCKLVAPSDPELAHLRGAWLPPPTLMRLLARAGYNFLLDDADGFTMPHVLTKSKALEAKGYRDIALFASRFAIASSRHNKAGEDKDMALFRVSKQTRNPDDFDAHFEPSPTDEALWHSVRYETARCVLAQFREADDDAVLSAVEGHETHLNLYKSLATELGEEEVNHIAKDSSPLLQQGIYTLLSLVRPFSWG